MVERISTSHLEENSNKLLATVNTDPANCNILQSKQQIKITTDQQQVSGLRDNILSLKSSKKISDAPISKKSASSFFLLDRLKIQQKNLLPILSHLISIHSNQKRATVAPSTQLTKPELLQQLKEKGYVALAEKLNAHTGYPWTEFEKIQAPILIEQLVDIYFLCDHKGVKKEETQKIIDFALHLAHLTTPHDFDQQSHSYELIKETKQVLGQIIYLMNQEPSWVIKAIDSPIYKQALEKIKDAYHFKIEEICKKLQHHYLIHSETQLQNPDTALYTKIPIEIAKTLLTDIGTINVGIIDSLSDVFLSHEKWQINHEVNLSHALNLLQRSPKLRAEFEKIHSPRSRKTPSQDIIRVTLGLSPNHIAREFDTRLTALIALLSHLRQGEDRSCFAVSLAIEVLSAHLGFCFKDLRQLLEEGKLIRRIKGVRKDIPFAKRISDENLHKKIIFNTEGRLIVNGQVKAPLWEAPGLQAACQAVGITHPKEVLLEIIQQLPPFAENQGFYKMEIKVLLQKICKKAYSSSKLKSSSLENLYTQACFAFSSQTAQPLLKIWENAIANMAEAEEGSMIKTAILESTLDALQFKLGELKIPPSPFLQRFFLHIQKTLYERMHLQYDPLIISSLGSDSKESAGGFILYNQKQRVNNEKSFRLFLLDILLDVNQKMRKNMTSDAEIQELNNILYTLTSYIDTPKFMGYLLARYHPSNQLAVSQLSQDTSCIYEHLQFTPWITQTGNNSKILLKLYFESDQPVQTEKLIVLGAEEALTHVIDICKHMSEEEKQLFLDNPNKLKPLCILGKHRLPFMAGNPSLVNAWQQNCSTQTWIERFVITPGKEISEKIIDEETKQQFIHLLQEKVLSNKMSLKKHQTILELIKKLPQDLTIKEYRHRILEICQTIHPLPTTHLSQKFIRQIDTTLCQSLRPDLKKKLEDSAVHFADTNWCDGIEDIHFCFAVNPGTGKLELWEAYANGTHLTALDQNYWLLDQKWEFSTLREDLIPDDSLYVSDF